METCHYCGLPAAIVERDHFPVPARHGGTETVPACPNCHTLKDRVSLDSWPAADRDAALAALSSTAGGTVPPIAFIAMWGEWHPDPYLLPTTWGEMTPLARLLWGRLLALRLDIAGRDDVPEPLARHLGLAA